MKTDPLQSGTVAAGNQELLGRGSPSAVQHHLLVPSPRLGQNLQDEQVPGAAREAETQCEQPAREYLFAFSQTFLASVSNNVQS